MKNIPGKIVLALLLFFATLLSSSFAAGEIRLERTFGPEVKTGPYKHPARMTQFQNGDFYLVYYGGEGEYADGTAVFGSRLKKGGNKWSPPRAIAKDPFRSLGNGVI